MLLYLDLRATSLSSPWIWLWDIYHYQSILNDPRRLLLVHAWPYMMAESVCQWRSQPLAQFRFKVSSMIRSDTM